MLSGISKLRSHLRITVTVLSFKIYVSAVVVLQHRNNSFCCERTALAVAVSNVVYGAPLGNVYPEIETEFLDMQTPVELVLDRVKHVVPPPRYPIIPDNDGNGIGFIVAATWAMALFGADLVSLPLFVHSLMGFVGIGIPLARRRDLEPA